MIKLYRQTCRTHEPAPYRSVTVYHFRLLSVTNLSLAAVLAFHETAKAGGFFSVSLLTKPLWECIILLHKRERNLMVESQLPKLIARVRFPPFAPIAESAHQADERIFISKKIKNSLLFALRWMLTNQKSCDILYMLPKYGSQIYNTEDGKNGL